MRILICGAAGFMGSHLFEHLQGLGHQVLGLDNYSIGTYRNPKILEADHLDKELTAEIISDFKPTLVYFLSAWAHEGLSQFCPIKITENNYTAYLNVLIPSIKAGMKRMILTSSMSVYGAQTPPFTEEMERKPEDVYAVSKTAMERTTEILSAVHGFEYNIVRPHNCYGNRQAMSDPYRNVVAIFINKCLKGEPFYIYGDGKQKRAFSYIDDVTPYLAEAGFINRSSEIINIGPLEEFSINELAKEIMKHFPNQPNPIYLPDRPLEVKNAWCSNDKAKALLGYQTSVPFSLGINKMVEWAKVVGYQPPKYLSELELVTKNTPKTWQEKLI